MTINFDDFNVSTMIDSIYSSTNLSSTVVVLI